MTNTDIFLSPLDTSNSHLTPVRGVSLFGNDDANNKEDQVIIGRVNYLVGLMHGV